MGCWTPRLKPHHICGLEPAAFLEGAKHMNIVNILNVLRALGAGGLIGALSRVAVAAEGVDGVLEKTPELTELKAALDDLRRALRSR